MVFAPAGGAEAYDATPVIGLSGFPLPVYPELKVVLGRRRIQEQLKAFGPDLVHVVNPFFLGVSGLACARRLGLPVVASYHTDVPGYVQRYGCGFLAGAVWRYTRWVYNQAVLTLCPSNPTRVELERHGIRRVKVWPHGVDTTRFMPSWRDAGFRRRLSDGHPEAPLLLYVGRVAREKRVDWLADACRALPHARLAVVGDGPAMGALRQRLAGCNVVFTGYLRGVALSQAYASADVFVSPSANETFGNVVLEAAASGLPVVAPRSGGVLDIVQHEETGLLCGPEERAGFVAAVERLVADPQLARRLGTEGCRRSSKWRWPDILDDMLLDYAWVCRVRSTTRKGGSRVTRLVG